MQYTLLKESSIHLFICIKFSQWPFLKKSDDFPREMITTLLISRTALVKKISHFIVLLTKRQNNSIYYQFSLTNHHGTLAKKKNATISLVSGR